MYLVVLVSCCAVVVIVVAGGGARAGGGLSSTMLSSSSSSSTSMRSTTTKFSSGRRAGRFRSSCSTADCGVSGELVEVPSSLLLLVFAVVVDAGFAAQPLVVVVVWL